MRYLYLLLNLFKKLPDTSTLDKTGIVKSDHPEKNNGWIKGWVLDDDIIIVCKHSNPSVSSPNNKIFVSDTNGNKYERIIVAIDKEPYNIGSDHSYYKGGDIAICKLNLPLPDCIKRYQVYTKDDVYGKKSVTINQYGQESRSSIIYKSALAYLYGRKRNIELIGGDSGLPWFVYDDTDKEWKVITHTFRGIWGEGPWYGKLYHVITKRVNALKDSFRVG